MQGSGPWTRDDSIFRVCESLQAGFWGVSGLSDEEVTEMPTSAPASCAPVCRIEVRACGGRGEPFNWSPRSLICERQLQGRTDWRIVLAISSGLSPFRFRTEYTRVSFAVN